MRLIIAEKQSVAESIAKVLGVTNKKTAISWEMITLCRGAWGIWCRLRQQIPTIKNTQNGIIRICPLFRKNGNIL